MSEHTNQVPAPEGAPFDGVAPLSQSQTTASTQTMPPAPSGAPVAHAEIPPPSGAPVAAQAAPAPMEVIPETTPTPPPPSGAPVEIPAQQTAEAIPPPPDGQPVIYDSNEGQKNGITKCPSCGSSDIQLNPKTGLLHCNYCQREFAEIADTIDGDISKLSGLHIGSGATDILYDASDAITLKCTACGAEVVVDTKEAPQARCHWCRNMLSLNQQVPNGAVPDAVMPFRIPKEQARKLIEDFVGKRRFYAHPQFRAEFNTENIMGVYLPYMVIDVNAHAVFRGEGEHETRRYTVGSGDDKETRYDADLYAVGREFDLHIDDLTIEASSERINQDTQVNSNNVINSILPYPLKEAVRFNANYLRGFTSEKRDLNRDNVGQLAAIQARDIARWRAWQQATFYDRGIVWNVEDVHIKGELWKTVYLPVWLYSYLQVKSNGEKFLHYVAVNACTGETMGSVPIHKPKLLAVSVIVEIIGIIVGVFLAILLMFS